MERISAGSTNAVAGVDKAVLTKEKMGEVLKNVAGALITAMTSGKDKDNVDLVVENFMTEIAGGMGEATSKMYSQRDDLASPADAMGPAMDGMLKAVSEMPVDRAPKNRVAEMYSRCVSIALPASSFLVLTRM